VSLEKTEPEAVFASYTEAEQTQNQFDVEQAFKVAQDLKDEYRQVISLRYMDDCSIGEIADILHKSKGSVSVLLFRAVREMKRILREKEY
jgi:RNA polymerase sigma-70 factor (ECF subfamily)